MATIEALQGLSEALSEITSRAAAWVVRVDGRRGSPASGAVLAPDLVVAASHSVARDEEIEVGLPGGETVPAVLAGRDPATDLAVLRVGSGGLQPAEWSEAVPRVGQLVLELSRPGRGPRAALGLVGRVGPEWRTPSGGRVERYIELDLALRPGLSGSLVLDATGRALGLAAGGLLRGTALAMPPATVRRVSEAIVAHGGVRRGFLGVATMPVRLPQAAGLEAGQGVALLLTAVEPGSPAEQAGLALGDVLLSVEGTPLAHAGELLPFLEPERIGQPLAARAWRAGAVREVRLVVGTRAGRRP